MTAFVFPGQGSQSVGMGRDMYDAFDIARHTFEEANDALNMDLKSIIFDGPMETLTLTENTQPALVTVSIAILRVFLQQSGKTIAECADYVAGHSLGEYAALCAAGVISFTDAVQLVKKRGAAMQSAVKSGDGAMAAVIGLNFNDIITCIKNIDGCNVANDNSPGQVVISGTKSAIDAATPLLTAAGAKRVILLPVSAPFHSPLMQPAADVMRDVLENVTFHKPIVPVVPNTLAQPCNDADILKSVLVDQICGSVRWRESIGGLHETGVQRFVEIGAGKVLTGLNKRIAPEATSSNINTPQDLDDFLKTT